MSSERQRRVIQPPKRFDDQDEYYVGRKDLRQGKALRQVYRILKKSEVRKDLKGQEVHTYWPEDATWYRAVVQEVDVKNMVAYLFYSETEEHEEVELSELIRDKQVAVIEVRNPNAKLKRGEIPVDLVDRATAVYEDEEEAHEEDEAQPTSPSDYEEEEQQETKTDRTGHKQVQRNKRSRELEDSFEGTKRQAVPSHVVGVVPATKTAVLPAGTSAPGGFVPISASSAPVFSLPPLSNGSSVGQASGAGDAELAQAEAFKNALLGALMQQFSTPPKPAAPGPAHPPAPAPSGHAPLASSGSLKRLGSHGSKELASTSSASLAVSEEEVRKKVREQLTAALEKAVEELHAEGFTDQLPAPADVAVAVEEALNALTPASGKDYKAKFRSLVFNLKDPSNPDLRARVLQGELKPADLVKLSPTELASRQVSEWRKKREDQAAKMVFLDTETAAKFSTAAAASLAADRQKAARVMVDVTKQRAASPPREPPPQEEDISKPQSPLPGDGDLEQPHEGPLPSPKRESSPSDWLTDPTERAAPAAAVAPSTSAAPTMLAPAVHTLLPAKPQSPIRRSLLSAALPTADEEYTVDVEPEAEAGDEAADIEPYDPDAYDPAAYYDPTSPDFSELEQPQLQPEVEEEINPEMVADVAPLILRAEEGGPNRPRETAGQVVYSGLLSLVGMEAVPVNISYMGGCGQLGSMLQADGKAPFVKGQVRLDKVENFFEELRRSRSRTMTIGVVRLAHNASDAARAIMAELIKAYRERDKTGVMTPSPFLEAYFLAKSMVTARLLKTARMVAPLSQVHLYPANIQPDEMLVAMVHKRETPAPAHVAGHLPPTPVQAPVSVPLPNAVPAGAPPADPRALHDPRSASVVDPRRGASEPQAALPISLESIAALAGLLDSGQPSSSASVAPPPPPAALNPAAAPAPLAPPAVVVLPPPANMPGQVPPPAPAASLTPMVVLQPDGSLTVVNVPQEAGPVQPGPFPQPVGPPAGPHGASPGHHGPPPGLMGQHPHEQPPVHDRLPPPGHEHFSPGHQDPPPGFMGHHPGRQDRQPSNHNRPPLPHHGPPPEFMGHHPAPERRPPGHENPPPPPRRGSLPGQDYPQPGHPGFEGPPRPGGHAGPPPPPHPRYEQGPQGPPSFAEHPEPGPFHPLDHPADQRPPFYDRPPPPGHHDMPGEGPDMHHHNRPRFHEYRGRGGRGRGPGRFGGPPPPHEPYGDHMGGPFRGPPPSHDDRMPFRDGPPDHGPRDYDGGYRPRDREGGHYHPEEQHGPPPFRPRGPPHDDRGPLRGEYMGRGDGGMYRGRGRDGPPPFRGRGRY